MGLAAVAVPVTTRFVQPSASRMGWGGAGSSTSRLNSSEILSGALSENGVAKLVGTKTFGKGSVQELINLTPDTSLKVTIAKWLTPKGNSISKLGITPDYVVPMTEDDVKTKKDPQMDKAIELLSKEK